MKKKFKKLEEKDIASLEGHENGCGGWEDDVKNLCQDLFHAFENRQARLKELRQETAEQLQEFRKEFAEQFKEFFDGLKTQQEERNEEVAAFLGNVRKEMAGFRQQCEQAASHWQHMCQTLAKKRAA